MQSEGVAKQGGPFTSTPAILPSFKSGAYSLLGGQKARRGAKERSWNSGTSAL